MSLKPQPIESVPEMTAQVARAAFPTGNPYLRLRDELGTLFSDADFEDLFPTRGQPGLAPWRLALVTVLQFRENLADRQAAEAVRARIDWKYLLGLELTDPGFDFSVLCEFRRRLLDNAAPQRLLEVLLEGLRKCGLVKARGRQRTDSTHVLAAVRALSRLELVGETLRAALNELATVAPDWLRGVTPTTWYERYSRRIEDSRLPRTEVERQDYAQTVGEDGFMLLDLLDSREAPTGLKELTQVQVLRLAWRRHYERCQSPTAGGSPRARFKANREVVQADERIESPYDPEARYRSKSGMNWTGYMVHLSETCDDHSVHLITHVHTTTADVHEIKGTDTIHQALVAKGLPPHTHLVDAAYIDAELLVRSPHEHGIELVGPLRENVSWQTKVEGAYAIEQFEIDWVRQQVRCPEGHWSSSWNDWVAPGGQQWMGARFHARDCQACSARAVCTRAQHQGRHLRFPPQPQYEAQRAARERLESEDGQSLYAQRAGIEGTLSQGVRAFGLRRTRYRGLAKAHLQHIATAAAIDLDRLAAWLMASPRGTTRVSRFAALAA